MRTATTPTGTDAQAWALAALLATQLMVILDGTIVNVALPTIRTDLGFTDTGLAWVVNGFFVAFAVLLLPAGRLGDLVGTRKVFVAGLVLFTAATALCGLATSPTSLVAARVAQGVGGALTSAVVLGMIAGLYADQAARGRAFALVAFVGSAGASIGVVAGGLLTELASWRWVFLVNVPLGVAVLVAAFVVLDETPDAPGLRRGLAESRALVPRTPAHPPGVPAAERGAVHDDGGRVLLPVPHRALPPGHPRPRRAAHRPGLPARDDRDRRGVAGRERAPGRTVRPRAGPGRRAGAVRRRDAVDGRAAGPRQLRAARGARLRGDGDRVRPRDAAGDGVGDGRRPPARRRGRVRVREHDPAGRRRRRAGRRGARRGETRVASAGFLVAAGALAVGTLVAAYLTGAAAGRRRPDDGPGPSSRAGTPTLERC